MSIINCKICSDQFDLDLEQEKTRTDENHNFYCIPCYDEMENNKMNKNLKLELQHENETFEDTNIMEELKE